MSKLSVLTSDNSPISLKVINNYYELFGLNIIDSCFDNTSVIESLLKLTKNKSSLDIITTDYERLNGNGLDLINTIRNLDDAITTQEGFKVKQIPIIMNSAYFSDTGSSVYKEILNKKATVIMQKPIHPNELIKNTIESVVKFRRSIFKDLNKCGLGLILEKGKIKICDSYRIPKNLNSQYLFLNNQPLQDVYEKLYLVNNSEIFENYSIQLFEELLNDPKTKEKDFNQFFIDFPNFLVNEFFSYMWSEVNFDIADSKKVRLDLLKVSDNGLSEDITIIELKRHLISILDNKKYHIDFAKKVYASITQLRNYKDALIKTINNKKQNNGNFYNQGNIKLVLLIGRFPFKNRDIYFKLKDRISDIVITTYDELLELNKIKLKYNKFYNKQN
jgi:CheY-like chemotaxis protein